ncbi:MAG: hypothetical protein HUU01_00485 [Saprospiraceae bacterium]|nr:hypothetical protein [Saprospiraceae bacterium]
MIPHHIRLAAHRYFLEKRLRTRPAPASRKPVNLDSCQSIGLLFDATEPATREIVLRYAQKLRERNKKVQLMGFYLEDQPEDSSSLPFLSFGRKQLNWALCPKSEHVEAFIDQKFDMLINLDTKAKVPATYIVALSQASFKVGPEMDSEWYFDLMIDVSRRPSLPHFIEQMESVLKKTNAKHVPIEV